MKWKSSLLCHYWNVPSTDSQKNEILPGCPTCSNTPHYVDEFSTHHCLDIWTNMWSVKYSGEVLTPLVWKARLSRLYSRARKLCICHTFDLFWDAISCEMVNNMFNSSRNVITFHCFCLLNCCLPSDFFVNQVISAGRTNHL